MTTKDHLENLLILKNHLLNINLLLDESLKIDKEMFTFSIRKVIPLPFIFKRVDCGKLLDKGEQILSELIIIRDDLISLSKVTLGQDRSIKIILEYTNIFIEAQIALNVVCEKLYLKAEGKEKLNYNEFNALCVKYKALDVKRGNCGVQLIDIARMLGFNAPK